MAMSGGIDSSIAAMILKNQGYTLIGATYRTFDQISESCLAKEKGCCSVDSIFEAKALALQVIAFARINNKRLLQPSLIVIDALHRNLAMLAL